MKINEFQFVEEKEINGKVYKVYELEKRENAILLDPVSFIPGKSQNPVIMLERIAVCGDKILKLPDTIGSGQTFICISLEDSRSAFTVST